ncbi:MAG: hypothetical protein MUE85_07690 [Microscillaceae bacterium]|jgi:hypothetical protein|nr:hypothetical protein [Microscillaceae bacterium]
METKAEKLSQAEEKLKAQIDSLRKRLENNKLVEEKLEKLKKEIEIIKG